MKNYFRLFLIGVLAIFSLVACQSSEQKPITIPPTEKVEIKTQIQDTIYESESVDTYNRTASNHNHSRNIGFGILGLGMLGMAADLSWLNKIRALLQYGWVLQFLFKMFSGIKLNKEFLKNIYDRWNENYGEVKLTPETLKDVNDLLPLIKVGGGIDTIRDMYVRANEDGVLNKMELIHNKIVSLGGYDDLLLFLNEAENLANEEKKKTL
ncbi:hypothetical protein V9L05_20580 [Bernardetia sp. Wsw4-3y2]|uniref:hypothetical protein n=1 Tax=Bernardetia sp. Wsw4-3y2 TaxID=3127471 RepID=UPI0030D058C3